MNFDLMLTGAVCESLFFTFDSEYHTIIDLVANGKDYDIKLFCADMPEMIPPSENS